MIPTVNAHTFSEGRERRCQNDGGRANRNKAFTRVLLISVRSFINERQADRSFA
jgi:hypothetical protein